MYIGASSCFSANSASRSLTAAEYCVSEKHRDLTSRLCLTPVPFPVPPHYKCIPLGKLASVVGFLSLIFVVWSLIWNTQGRLSEGPSGVHLDLPDAFFVGFLIRGLGCVWSGLGAGLGRPGWSLGSEEVCGRGGRCRARAAGTQLQSPSHTRETPLATCSLIPQTLLQHAPLPFPSL